MKISVVGTGYVGLVVGACLAENGHEVICVDKDEAKVRALQKGKIPIYEPGLEELVKRNRVEKRLSFTTLLPRAVRQTQIIFIAVGTPEAEDGSADLQHVLGVARDVARAMNGYKVIVDKSTVPVGTAEKVREVIRRETTHPVQRRQQPRVPEAGRRGQRLPQARSRRDWRRRPARRRADEGALRALHPHRRADHGDGLRQRRAVQVRRERDARDPHLVHERSRARLRSLRRQRRRSPPRHRLRHPHRRRVPVPGRAATAAAASRRTSRRS